MTPTGLEQSANPQGKTTNSVPVPPLVPPSNAITAILQHPQTAELLAIWSALDDAARRDLIGVARAWRGSSQGVTQ